MSCRSCCYCESHAVLQVQWVICCKKDQTPQTCSKMHKRLRKVTEVVENVQTVALSESIAMQVGWSGMEKQNHIDHSLQMV